MEDFVPQVVDVVASSGTASMYAAWPGVVRDALRRAGREGLYRFQIWDLLAARDAIEHRKSHERAMLDALEYLEHVGLANKVGARWYDVPALPLRPRSQPCTTCC